MFSTTLNHEYAVAAELLGLDEAGVADLATAAVRASFLDDGGQASLCSTRSTHYARPWPTGRVSPADYPRDRA